MPSPWPDAAIETWRFAATRRTTVHVPPDGCRDLIVIAPLGAAPACLASALAESTETHVFAPGDRAAGVRLRPGVQVDERALAAWLQRRERLDEGQLLAAAGEVARQDARVDEALACLGEAPPLRLAQARLGVSARSLERLLSGHTQRGPLWWRSLARARRCARALAGDAALAELAADHGYADQAHMTRDLRRWFGATPARLRASPAFFVTLAGPAYA